MNEEARKFRENVENLEGRFSKAKTELETYERVCRHQFSETVYDPIYHKAYTIPGDPPGTMGVDWRGPCNVPSETIDRWKRECTECGLVEYTKRIKEEIKKIPKW